MRLNSLTQRDDELYICEGVNMGKKALDKMMSGDSNVIVGFEAEFETTEVFDKSWWQTEDLDPDNCNLDDVEDNHWNWDAEQFQDNYIEWYDKKYDEYTDANWEYLQDATYEDIEYDHGSEIRSEIEDKYVEKYEDDEQFEDEDDKREAIIEYWQHDIDEEVRDAIREHEDWDEVYANKADTNFQDDVQSGRDDYFEDERYEIYSYMGIDIDEGDDSIDEDRLDDYGTKLADACGFKFEEICSGYDCASKNKDGWFLETDGEGPELVSPALPIGESMGYLEKILNYLANDETVETNENTGMHVSVNIDGKDGKDYDILKIALFLGEQYVGQLFGRDDKSVRGKNWAEEHLPFLMKAMQKLAAEQYEFTPKDLFAIMDKNYDQFLSGFSLAEGNRKRIIEELEEFGRYVFDAVFKESRYRVFNLDHLDEKGYIEFRKMGGIDYHKKYEDVRNTILRYAYVLKLATEPELERKEYQKKLYKLFSKMAGITDQSKNDERRFGIGEKMFDKAWVDVKVVLSAGDANVREHQVNGSNGIKGKLRAGLNSPENQKLVDDAVVYAVVYMAGLWKKSTLAGNGVDLPKYRSMFRLILNKLKMDKELFDKGFDKLLIRSNLQSETNTSNGDEMTMKEFRDRAWAAIEKLAK